MREPQAALTLEMVGLGVRWPIAIESSVLEIVRSLRRQPSSTTPRSTVNRTRADCQPQAWSRAGMHIGVRDEGVLWWPDATHRQALGLLLEREASSSIPPGRSFEEKEHALCSCPAAAHLVVVEAHRGR